MFFETYWETVSTPAGILLERVTCGTALQRPRSRRPSLRDDTRLYRVTVSELVGEALDLGGREFDDHAAFTLITVHFLSMPDAWLAAEPCTPQSRLLRLNKHTQRPLQTVQTSSTDSLIKPRSVSHPLHNVPRGRVSCCKQGPNVKFFF